MGIYNGYIIGTGNNCLPDRDGRAWSKPTTHGTSHGQHRDIQLKNGRHVTVVPKNINN
jgi:hypothetical protein